MVSLVLSTWLCQTHTHSCLDAPRYHILHTLFHAIPFRSKFELCKSHSLYYSHMFYSPNPARHCVAYHRPQTLLRWDILRDFSTTRSPFVESQCCVVARKIPASLAIHTIYSLLFTFFHFILLRQRLKGSGCITSSTSDDCSAFNTPIRVFQSRNSTSVRKCGRCQVNI